MRKLMIGLGVVAAALIASRVSASIVGYPISGSKHDFKTTGYTGDGGTFVGHNKCGTCHAAHKVKKVSPLWGRDNPTATGWIVWNGQDAGQALDGTENTAEFLSAAELTGTGTGMCMSCHDGQTAIGTYKDATGTSVPVYMRAAYRGTWGRALADMHPVGHVVPFGAPGWKADLAAGNAASGSNVATEARGSVGCTSCHSMHNSENSSKILRGGDRCLACHDR